MELKMSLIESMIAKGFEAPSAMREFKPKKIYKPMSTASQEEIEAHNSEVDSRQVKRAKARDEAKLIRV